VVPALLDVHANWHKRVPTAGVNRVFEKAQELQPAPRGGGRILYGTQVSAAPPRFVVFTTGDLTPVYRRFLENRLRDEFGFEGVPIRLSIRKRGRKR
jgi:GTP-binding protein